MLPQHAYGNQSLHVHRCIMHVMALITNVQGDGRQEQVTSDAPRPFGVNATLPSRLGIREQASLTAPGPFLMLTVQSSRLNIPGSRLLPSLAT